MRRGVDAARPRLHAYTPASLAARRPTLAAHLARRSNTDSSDAAACSRILRCSSSFCFRSTSCFSDFSLIRSARLLSSFSSSFGGTAFFTSFFASFFALFASFGGFGATGRCLVLNRVLKPSPNPLREAGFGSTEDVPDADESRSPRVEGPHMLKRLEPRPPFFVQLVKLWPSPIDEMRDPDSARLSSFLFMRPRSMLSRLPPFFFSLGALELRSSSSAERLNATIGCVDYAEPVGAVRVRSTEAVALEAKTKRLFCSACE